MSNSGCQMSGNGLPERQAAAEGYSLGTPNLLTLQMSSQRLC